MQGGVVSFASATILVSNCLGSPLHKGPFRLTTVVLSVVFRARFSLSFRYCFSDQDQIVSGLE